MARRRSNKRNRNSNSSGQYTFAQAPSVGVQRSVFDRTHAHKTTVDASLLYPIYVDEVLPGDTHSVRPYIFARLATPLVPVMDTIKADVHFFFVPNRLVQTNWPKVMGQVEVDDSADYFTAKIATPPGGFTENSMADYFGLPTKKDIRNPVAYPFRAYNLIFNEWYRSLWTQPATQVITDDGPDDAGIYVLKARNKQHDYFTSALPSRQSGDPVELPLGGTAPVTADDTTPGTSDVPTFNIGAGAPSTLSNTGAGTAQWGTPQAGTQDAAWDSTGLVADLAQATASTIADIRLAFQTQRFLEREQRSGRRYTEILRSQFQVTPEDMRLQRPELLGAGSAYVNIAPVPQTSETTGTSNTPQGNLAAFGVMGDYAGGFTKSFTEHGYIIGLLSIRSNLSYSEGYHRSWTRNERFDYFWPVFSHISEQGILNEEIQARGVQGTGSDQDQGLWAFQERWAEYRYKQSLITGRFRPNANNTLAYWHLSEYFDTDFPSYNGVFLEDKSPIERIIAVQDEPEFIVDMEFKVKSVRPMPTYSVPGYVDHF